MRLIPWTLQSGSEQVWLHMHCYIITVGHQLTQVLLSEMLAHVDVFCEKLA
jgi:hypothetical protein